ncbi:hypothetical protein EK21DRAFT_116262 [Setomelanomma holmii]|uniref:Tetratricopeptide repeat protein n=1 Tax=Setomelanomma holmii TaxID=210430 RepID=A0A9P4H2S6_9PLEO|nr:hypothetical protein EK21DRAFT_116262 [Setomelanomma holmii]
MHRTASHDALFTNALDGLGLEQLLFGDAAAAEQCFRTSLREKERTLPPGHWDIVKSMVHLARALDAQGKWIEAEALHQSAVERYAERYGQDGKETVEIRWELMRVLEKLGKDEEALDMSEGMWEVIRKSAGDEHVDAKECWNDVLRLRTKLGTSGQEGIVMNGEDHLEAVVRE